MTAVSLTYARAHLCELIDRAAGGEAFDITRRGKIVARLEPPVLPRKPIDLAELQAVTDSMPMPEGGAPGDFIRWMRDTDRY